MLEALENFDELPEAGGKEALMRVQTDLVGHMTERMQDHYSHVDVAEKRAALPR